MSFTSIILRVALIGFVGMFIIISLCGCYGPKSMQYSPGSWEFQDCRSRIEP